ncbi:unnamed protein product [Arctia plantaginis]|uniref:Uncharacterized protein n=1 Tax=Arctia plantaginis TaxID=874455 RepID=A0A8S1B024_ARCPL|nr:unnamed protein product [Arctia plantaginis]
MFSNISYFSKSGDQNSPGEYRREESPSPNYYANEPSKSIDFEAIEPDSTSKPTSTSLKLPASIQNFTASKGSLSDTDLLNIDVSKSRRSKQLKLDIKKASQSLTENLYYTDSAYIENTPKHISLDSKSADLFSEKFRKLNFNNSFDFDMTSESSEDELGIESLSECSDTDISIKNDIEKLEIRMCRKVDSKCETAPLPSVTPESFGDVELDKNEEDRVLLLLNYQMKFEKIERLLKKLLSEFQFHIEVSKIFNGRSIMTVLAGTDVSNIPKDLGQVMYMDNVKCESPTDSWNVVIEKEDNNTKIKFRKQILSLKNCLDQFAYNYLQTLDAEDGKRQRMKKSITFDLHKGQRIHKNMKMSTKKRMRHFDFPDYRDAFLNLFDIDTADETDIQMQQNHDECLQKCCCNCHNPSLDHSDDSGLTTKTENLSNQSITSSIGNFSLDSITLSAYSESLDQIISYNSFQDTSLLNTLLQKPAIERITFYVQVHSIQLTCEAGDGYESKSTITFLCPACEITEIEEDELLRHILSQTHCEKIHFLYKTAYIKKCVASGKEIQPSTVLNPMRLYRDDNKIVCFGDAVYACSLCFENFIVGESILMAHCNDETHLERRDKLSELYE